MTLVEIIIVFAFAVTISNVVNRILPNIPLPLIQIFFGVLIGMTEIGSDITFVPELFLVMIIAPLLFREGETINVRALLNNLGTIIFLAFGGVILTLLGVGVTLYYLLPTVPLAACFAFGAALGPTDAVAVKSLSGRLSLPERSLQILEGEGLLNDASGVTAFQFAIAALTTGSFSLLNASETLLFSTIGGILVGVILVWLKRQVVQLIEKAAAKDVAGYLLIELLLPFLAYLIAEEFHVSGIIAVVVSGVLQASEFQKVSIFDAKLSNVSDTTWSTMAFMLNALVFIFLGVELSQVFSPIWQSSVYSNWHLFFVVVVITIMLFVLRFVFITVFWGFKDGFKKLRSQFHDILVLTFGGVKGTVSLATIFILPLTINDMTFEYRSLLLFITACVILMTLLVGILVLPLLAGDEPEEVSETDRLNIDILREVMDELNQELPTKPEAIQNIAAETVIDNYQDRISELHGQHMTNSEKQEVQELQALIISIEKDSLDRSYREGKISANGYRFYSRFIADFENSVTRQILSFLGFWLIFVRQIVVIFTHPRLWWERNRTPRNRLLNEKDVTAIRELLEHNSQLIFDSFENLEGVYDESLLQYFTNKRKILLSRINQGTLITAMTIQQEPVYEKEMIRGYYLERKIIDSYEVSEKISTLEANSFRQEVNLLESYSINNLNEREPLSLLIRRKGGTKKNVSQVSQNEDGEN
ncbi:cation:proton antiporter [Enterococcus sp. LJL120]